MAARSMTVALLIVATVACGATSTGTRPTSTPTATSPTASPTTASRTPSTAPSVSPTSTRPSTGTATPTPTGLPAALLGHVVTRIPTARKVVALTFDAGANGDGVPSILATLSREGVPATFFLTGGFATTFPDLARRLARAGVIGDHTVGHPHLPQVDDAKVRAEVTDARTTILRVTGVDPRPWFRFPYGESDARTIRLVNALGFVAIGWTFGSPGYLGTSGGSSVSAVVSRLTSVRTPGEILLMHVGSNPDDHTTLDADALPQVIERLRAAGYSFVTVRTLLGAGT